MAETEEKVNTGANGKAPNKAETEEKVNTEANGEAPKQTEGGDCDAKMESESSATKTETETSAAKTEPESSATKTETETSAAKTEPESSAAKTEPESSAAKTEPESSAAKTEPESSAAKMETESSVGETETETSAAKTEPESSAAKMETESSVGKTETDSGAAKTEPESSAAKMETESIVGKTETESSAAKMETDSSTAKTESETSAAKVETESESGGAMTQEEPTKKEKKIIRQVEYYFGDINLARDKFLQEQMKQDDGWVTLETMLKFNRLKTLSGDAEEICKALRKSKNDLLEVTDDNTKLRRSKSKPLPENTTERKAELKTRSIYAKGFPLDCTMDKIEEFFKDHGNVENIQMRRKQKKEFKGSVFAIFEKPEDAEKFVKAENIKYEGKELIRTTKDDYFKRKDEERQQLKLKKERERQANKGAGDQKEGKEKKTEEEEIKEKMTPGAILHLSGFEGDVTIDDVRNFFSDYATVRWVDFEKGDKEALVRFIEANEAGVVLEKLKVANEGKVVFNKLTLEGDVLEGDAEIAHWKKIFQAQAERMKMGGRNKNQRGRKRGPFGFRKGYRNRESESGGKEKADGEPPAKAVKTE